MAQENYIGIYWNKKFGYRVTLSDNPDACITQSNRMTDALGYEHVSTIISKDMDIFPKVYGFVERLDPKEKKEKITLTEILNNS